MSISSRKEKLLSVTPVPEDASSGQFTPIIISSEPLWKPQTITPFSSKQPRAAVNLSLPLFIYLLNSTELFLLRSSH